MQFNDLLLPEAVKVASSVSSKKRLLHGLADLAEGVFGLDGTSAFEALVARESLGTTGVGHGVALPHARIDGLDKVVGAFMLLESPVDFDAVDRQPVDLAFGLFAPQEAGVEHLKALALVSRTLRQGSLCTKLRANIGNAQTIFTILTEDEEVRAA